MQTVSAPLPELKTAPVLIVAFGVVLAGLVYGRSFLLPLAFALLFTTLLNAIIDRIARVKFAGHLIPRWLAIILGIGVVSLAFWFAFRILSGQADAVSAAWPRYVERFERIAGDVADYIGPQLSARIERGLQEIDPAGRIPGLLGSAGSMLTSVAMILLYVAFLMVERGHFTRKLIVLLVGKASPSEVERVANSVSAGIQRYLWMKTLMSVLTGACSYVVLRALGVDFAETWSFLIFLLNYIPSIGSILGVIFPAILALIQFDTTWQFFVIAVFLSAVQFVIGNVIEPALMGRSLNLSSFVIILALTFWGTIWGLPGMFLSVPIVAMMMIVCSHIPSWRWVAVLLASDEQLALDNTETQT